jgi:F-type H+-transporting ATPase subunit epsilon
MSKLKLKLTIISQEKQLATQEVDSVTAPTAEGEITVLPGHIPLLSRLQTGELRCKVENEEVLYVVTKGFIDVQPNNEVIIMVDAAVDAREISVEKAEKAVQAAHETMAQTTNQRELIMAEASLRRALLEIKVAQKTKRTQI